MRRGRRAGLRPPAWLIAAALPFTSAAAAAGQSRVAVLEEPDAVAVGVAVVLNSGIPWELESETGLTRLAALAAIEQVRPQLDALGGRVHLECHAAATTLSLLLPPATWRLGTVLFLDALFEQDVSAEAIERARSRLLESLSAQDPFTSGVRAALGRALFGEDDRWARPPCGRVETVAKLTEADVRRIRRARFHPSRATIAIAGPVTAADARGILAGFADGDGLPLIVPAPARREEAASVHVQSSTVTTWVTLAFPFPAGTDVEALRLLGFRLREALGPAPARPDVFEVATSIERHGDGGWLTVTLVTLPEAAADRATEARALLRDAAKTTMPDDAFDALLRRFRGERLLELATPEARARDAALQLFFDRAVKAPAARIDALRPSRLRRAAAALSPPSSATLGPP
ncbi:MAG TPA: hypothetical protein VF158_13295 [Longimicrobiales bacterium]